jgi:hypothetical protein
MINVCVPSEEDSERETCPPIHINTYTSLNKEMSSILGRSSTGDLPGGNT